MPPINMVLWGMVHGVVLPTLYYRLSLAMDVSIEHPLYINDVKNVNPLISWLVVLTILKNTSQWEGLSHKWWKMQKMFQTTNQLVSIPPFTVSSPDQSRRAHPCGEKPIVLPRHARLLRGPQNSRFPSPVLTPIFGFEAANFEQHQSKNNPKPWTSIRTIQWLYKKL